jgi:hypothetical protein
MGTQHYTRHDTGTEPFCDSDSHPMMVYLAGHSFYEPWPESFVKRSPTPPSMAKERC